ncbi:stage V sporulation protein B [Orenia marismortui]|uniref:stage V sporulation protein B n=1 Tax=Orenia marismortui TaxID=46469 RepID=UPI001FD34633|nr:stage V sporulation protein B [Orenia marismortui]
MIKIKHQSLIKGAFILMLAGLFNRVLGFILRIILVRIIGDEGLGLFQMVFPIFITFSIITTMGLPVAVSKFVSEEVAKERYRNALKIFKISMLIVILSTLIIVALFAVKADFIAQKLLNDNRTYYILLSITPALLFVSLSSIFRGFFQGLRIMTPTAISQIFEQVARMIITLLLLAKLIEASLNYQTLAPAIGTSAGELVGFLTLSVIFVYYLPQLRSFKDSTTSDSTFSILKKLIKFGIPITIGRIVASLMYTVEAITIPGKLQEVGYSISQATSLYGQLSGMVLQLIYLPTIITIALNSNLIPAISESVAQNNNNAIRKRSQEAIRLTFYFGFLANIILFIVPEEICNLLFNYPQAGDILRILALPAICLYLSQISGGILQGLGAPNLVVRNSIISLMAELLLIYSVIYLPHSLAFEIIPCSIAIRYIIMTLLNFRSISKQVKLNLPINHLFIKPILAGILVVMILPQLYKVINYMSANNTLSLILAIIFSSVFYFAFLLWTNGIVIDDFKKIAK